MARPRKHIIPEIEIPSVIHRSLFMYLKEGPVNVKGLGRFEVVQIPQKKLFHNFSGRTRIMKAYGKLKFTQSPELKEQLSQK